LSRPQPPSPLFPYTTLFRSVEIDQEDLDAVQIESSHTIEIDAFVSREEIDERYFEKPYFIAPDGKTGIDAFAVIRDAMKRQDKRSEEHTSELQSRENLVCRL